MEIKVEKRLTKKNIPRIGDIWQHEYSEFIYMRINDKQGNIIEGHKKKDIEKYFYSICLNNGESAHTDRDANDIIILQPKDNILILEEKGE